MKRLLIGALIAAAYFIPTLGVEIGIDRGTLGKFFRGSAKTVETFQVDFDQATAQLKGEALVNAVKDKIASLYEIPRESIERMVVWIPSGTSFQIHGVDDTDSIELLSSAVLSERISIHVLVNEREFESI